MKRFLKKAYYFISSHIIIPLLNFNKPRLVYSNINNGKALILGTGPSMADFLNTSTLLHEVDLICVNDFALSEFYERIKPTYYVLVDPSYWREPSYVNETDLNLRNKLFDRIEKVTNWDITFIIPSIAFTNHFFQNVFSTNNCIHFRPINIYGVSAFTQSYINCLYYNYIAPSQNVMATAILAAINLGYKEIGICGVEHSWTKDIRVNEDNQVCTIKKHFYTTEEVLIPWEKPAGGTFKMSEILLALNKTFQSYEILALYAASKNARIVNYTKDSFIDSFERGAL